MATIARVTTCSATLLAGERKIFERYTRTLAALLAEERELAADAVEPWVIANVLLEDHRSLYPEDWPTAEWAPWAASGY